jgi:hypothetical protein
MRVPASNRAFLRRITFKHLVPGYNQKDGMNIKYLVRKEKLCLIFRVIPVRKIVQVGSFMAIAIVFARGAGSTTL